MLKQIKISETAGKTVEQVTITNGNLIQVYTDDTFSFTSLFFDEEDPDVKEFILRLPVAEFIELGLGSYAEYQVEEAAALTRRKARAELARRERDLTELVRLKELYPEKF